MAKTINKTNTKEPASNRPDKAVEAGTLVTDTGLSNTRCIAPLDTSVPLDLNVLMDWFKFSFNKRFDPHDPYWHRLLNALKVDYKEYDIDRGGSGSKESYWFDASVAFFTGGERTKSNGQETTWLDMSGQACREFEERDGNWKELIEVVLSMVDRGNRLDCAIDDFLGLIKLSELQDKIMSHSYTTNLRRLVLKGEVDETGTGETDRPLITLSKNEGFTATFGGKSTKQLQIYNKKAERAAHEYLVIPDTWIRYEARFYHEAAISALRILYAGLCGDTFPHAVAGLVGGLVEFKETSTTGNRHACRIPTWDKWNHLLKGVSGIKVKNQARIELSLARKHEWIKTAAGRTMGMVYLAEPTEFDNIVGFIVEAWRKKMNRRSVASVNILRRRYGKPTITYDDAVEQLRTRFESYGDLSPYLQSIFHEYDASTGELKDYEE